MTKSINNFTGQRMWGIVTKYNADRGFGFIRSKVDGRSYFVHISQIQDRILDVGYLVEFGVGINRKSEKEEAKNVIVVEAPTHRSMRKGYDHKGDKRPVKGEETVEEHKNIYRVPCCGECEFMKMYNYRYKKYYCDHEKRIDDMGSLGENHLPKAIPAWCPLKEK